MAPRRRGTPVIAVTLLNATEAQMGYLNAAATAAFLLVANAVGFAASAASLAVIRHEEVPPLRSDRQGLVDEIREGLAFVFSQPLVRRVLLTTASSNMASTALFTLMPILVLRILGVTPQVLGMVLSVAAVGGLGSAFGTVPAMWAGVAIGLIAILPLLTGPYGRMRELPTRPE